MNTRTLLTLFIILLALTACTTTAPTTEDGLPIFQVDEAHMQNQDTMGEFYQTSNTNGFALELSGYKFKVPESLGVDRVNMIQVSLSPEHLYYIDVTDITRTQYRISEQTLSAVEGSQPFPGFQPGDVITVGVGYQNNDKQFFAMWIGFVEIVEPTPTP